MTVWKFHSILQEEGFSSSILLETDSSGKIIKFFPDENKVNIDHIIDGILIPGFVNGHSHAFQYAFSGMTEYLSSDLKSDNFWSWREKMYEFALKTTPNQLEKIATHLYCEMVSMGYTHVAEFHYLHHDDLGRPYPILEEMSSVLFSAAETAQISLTLVPALYQRGGFEKEANSQQKRFLFKKVEDFLKLVEKIETHTKSYEDFSYGVAAHSLRAVGIEEIKDLFSSLSYNVPKHIHIAEQEKEVEECLHYHKFRPVEYFFENIDVNENINFVHATHINDNEVNLLAKSKANVILCPSTEANLGDGFFPLIPYQKAKGKWSIGSDGQTTINPMEELRWLDYGQRLLKKMRNPLCFKKDEQSGEKLTSMVWKNGPASVGKIQDKKEDFFNLGDPLTGIVLNTEHFLFKKRDPQYILSTLIFCGQHKLIMGTLKNGKWTSKKGKHILD